MQTPTESFDLYINDVYDINYHGDEIAEVAKIVEASSSMVAMRILYQRNV